MAKKFCTWMPLVVIALCSLSTARATVLGFDFSPRLAGNDPIPQAYGDNVTATVMGAFIYGAAGGFTPDVLVSYSTLLANGTTKYSETLFWPNSYATLSDFMISRSDPDDIGYGEIQFTPLNGKFVSLISFDMAAFNGTGNRTNQSVRILDAGGNVLWGGNQTINAGVVTTFFPGIVSSGALRLQFGNDWFVGIDNVAFAQADTSIPEPSTFALAVLGLAAAALFRRK